MICTLGELFKNRRILSGRKERRQLNSTHPILWLANGTLQFTTSSLGGWSSPELKGDRSLENPKASSSVTSNLLGKITFSTWSKLHWVCVLCTAPPPHPMNQSRRRGDGKEEVEPVPLDHLGNSDCNSGLDFPLQVIQTSFDGEFSSEVSVTYWPPPGHMSLFFS